jgi:hypothetical protein
MEGHDAGFEGEVEPGFGKLIDLLPKILGPLGQILAGDSLNGPILVMHHSLHLFLLLSVLFLLLSLRLIGLNPFFDCVLYRGELIDGRFLAEDAVEDVTGDCRDM